MKNIILVSLLAVAVSPADAAVKLDKSAPAFTLPDTAGKERSLAEFKGKTVVLEWHNKGCPFVVKHYASGNMPKLQKQTTAKDVVWLTIISSAKGKQGYVTGPEADADMKTADASPTHVLLDPEGKVGRLYGAKTTPHMYVIDKAGVLRYNGAIDSISSSDAADIAKADNYVVSAVDAVLAGKKVAKPSTQPYGCSVKYDK